MLNFQMDKSTKTRYNHSKIGYWCHVCDLNRPYLQMIKFQFLNNQIKSYLRVMQKQWI